MQLTTKQLLDLLSEAFDLGYSGTEAEREAVIADLLERHNFREADDSPTGTVSSDDFRVWTVDELRALPAGSVFTHEVLGRCQITVRKGEPCMTFDNPGLAASGIQLDGYPWNIPMRRES